MRLAVLIIGLCLVVLFGMPSCTVDQDHSGWGAIGMLLWFLFILGSAFVFKCPKVSSIIFLVASFFGFVGFSGSTCDLSFWSFISLVLAAMSYFGIKEKKKKDEFKASKN